MPGLYLSQRENQTCGDDNCSAVCPLIQDRRDSAKSILVYGRCMRALRRHATQYSETATHRVIYATITAL